MNELWSDKKEKLVFFVLMLYSATALMFDADESKIRYTYVTYSLLCLTLIVCKPRIKFHKETYGLIGYMLFGFLSILWAEDRRTAITRSRGVLFLMIGFVLLYDYIKHTRKPQIMIYAVIVGTVALAVYVFLTYGFGGVIDSIRQGGIRLGSKINNVNMIANTMSIGIVSIIGIALFYNKKWLLVSLIPIGAAFIAAGSRTATLSLAAGGLAVILFYIRSRSGVFNKFTNILLAVIAIIALWSVLQNIPAFQTILIRLKNAFSISSGEGSFLKENSAETRLDYIELGWAQFLKNPFFGNGIGCAGYAITEDHTYITYLHNNYVEILASGGIVGFLLFYSPYFIALKHHFRYVFKSRVSDPAINISFALLITKLIAHMGTVVYYSKIEYMLFVLWLGVIFTRRDINNA